MDRTILHCDLNGFYASVECLFNPALKTAPMAVAGNPENRHGIILAKNELAKKQGVKTAETIFQAKKKCPELVLVRPQHKEYAKYSVFANDIYGEFTDLIEPFGIDESWLDVTGVLHLFGTGKQIADKIRDVMKDRLGLTVSIGVSFNKIFAKLGSDYKKPDATTVITKENFKQILYPLPVTDMLYVGKASAETLKNLHIETIGELAVSDKNLLRSKLGKMGDMLWDYANGLEDSPVKPATEGRDIKSVGNGLTFKRNLIGLSDIKTGTAALSDEVAYRLRKYGLKCRTVQVTIKDPAFKSINRQKSAPYPTYLAKDINAIALEIIKSCWSLKAPIRMLTITGMNLIDENHITEQLTLFDDETDTAVKKQERLELTIDKIREKYGKSAVITGSILNNELGIDGDS